MQRFNTFLDACSRMGAFNTLFYVWKAKVVERWHRLVGPSVDGYRTGTLDTSQARHPLVFRHGSSDIAVFSQIFVSNEFGPLPDLANVRLIVDCGANVGYAAAYLLSKYRLLRRICGLGANDSEGFRSSSVF